MELAWWPLFGVRIVTPRLVLQPIADDHLDQLCALVAGGVHPPGEMPFYEPWTDLAPPALQRGSLQYHWRVRADWRATAWRLPFGIWEDGQLVGQQDVAATDFAVRRTVETGSWLGLPHQGRGIGKEMRAAALHFAFAGLGAERAETDAFTDNPASLAVTRSQGYEPNGGGVRSRKGTPAEVAHFTLARSVWHARRRDDITIEGLDEALSRFGA